MDNQEIIYEDANLYLAARHLGHGKIEFFTWTKDHGVKVYQAAPVDGEFLLTRVGLKLKSTDDGLDITGIN